MNAGETPFFLISESHQSVDQKDLPLARSIRPRDTVFVLAMNTTFYRFSIRLGDVILLQR